MKITDFNNDCLIEVFKYLNLRNLINVAVSNQFLREAARIVYSRKFKNEMITIDILFNDFQIDAYDILTSIDGVHTLYWIKIYDLKTCLQYLRCFGLFITKLQLAYYQNIHRYYYVEQYINRYCVNSLISISFFNKPQFRRENFQNPFTKVERVHIDSTVLDDELPLFAEWFPNVRCLELCDIHVDRHFTEATFHHLENLTIDIWSLYPPDYSKISAANLLRLNSQLKVLTINMPFITLTTLLGILSENRSISKLIIPLKFHSVGVDTSELIQLAREHPALVKLDLQQFRFFADDVILVIRKLNLLKTFRFILFNISEYGSLIGQLNHAWKSSINQEWYENIHHIITLKRKNVS